MLIPGADALRVERHAVLATLDSLTDDEFASAPTLCSEWSPRDILGHLMGVDGTLMPYVQARGSIGGGNRSIVERSRLQSRAQLMAAGRQWADHPSPVILISAWFFLGDTTVHHQDILRGLGRSRDIPESGRAAIMREGMLLGVKKLLSTRAVPTDGGRAVGRGDEVRGTREALGLWLAGREGLEPELEFS